MLIKHQIFIKFIRKKVNTMSRMFQYSLEDLCNMKRSENEKIWLELFKIASIEEKEFLLPYKDALLNAHTCKKFADDDGICVFCVKKLE
jgi:hypothetical protein